jgi:hypothetical protein
VGFDSWLEIWWGICRVEIVMKMKVVKKWWGTRFLHLLAQGSVAVNFIF